MRQLKPYVFFLSLIAVFIGCKNIKPVKPFGEGTIVYSMTFESNQNSNVNPKLLPNRLTIKFRNNNTTSKIEGMSGSVNLKYIYNVNEQKCTILVNLWNKKLLYQDTLSNIDVPNAFSGMKKIRIEKTSETVRFKGFRCLKAIAYCNHSTNENFEILYTKDITIANPNANTPFSSIDGVMLKFSVKLPKYTVKVCAETIEQEKIPNEEFSTPSGYEQVSKRTIEDLISLIQ